MAEGLDDFLNGPQVEETAVVEEPKVEPEATPEPGAEKAEPARDEKGRFAPKGDKEDVSPTSKEEFDGKATIGERRRRQEAEARIAELEAQIQTLSNPPQPAPDMFENPEGWQGHFGSQVVSQAVQQATLNARLDMSEMMVRQANADFDGMKALFMDLAKDNPTLAQQALADPHPWNKAYQIAKNHERMQSLGAVDVTDLENKLREKIKAELEAEKAPAVELPTSLATAQPGSGPAVAQPTGFMSLEDILKR